MLTKLEIMAAVNQTSLMPGYKTYTYRLVLLPHEEFRKKLMKVRKEFAEKYQLRNYPKAAFLTLVKFEQFAMMESRIIQKLESLTMRQRGFVVEVNGYGSYPDHSIFLNISNTSNVRNLVHDLQSLKSLMHSVNGKPYFIRDIHFQIGSGLKPWQYENGWKDYQKRHFTGSFVSEELLLLKHVPDSPNFEILRRFEFRNIAVTTQPELFGEFH